MRQQHRVPRHRWRAIAAGSAFALVATSFTMGAAVADDGGNGEAGKPVSKSMSSEGNPKNTVAGYLNENEHAFVGMMKFYVPSQAADGTVLDDESTGLTADYYNVDGEFVESLAKAKPLVGVYINGPVDEVEGLGFSGHGKRDAFASVSLDDGVTWKNTNLSESADQTSMKASDPDSVYRTDIQLFEDTDYAYPGDVTNVFHAIAGNKVVVAWPSRFCSSGQPNYSLDNLEKPDLLARRAAIASYLKIDLTTASADDLYLIDMFGVGGNQGFVDYAEDKWEQNWPVGKVPFNCLWAARGQIVLGDDPRTPAFEASYMRWFKAERLTSGRRDVNRIEAQCVEGAGCAITWQEDPDGLRPGQGEGPGEGWSGAIANSQTDVWYSYIDWENFDVVQDPADDTEDMTFADYEALAATDPDPENETDTITQKPKPFVPFAMPMRMTDNAKCNPVNPQPYCYGSALAGPETITDPENVPVFPDADALPVDYGLKDMCKAIIQIPSGPNDELKPVCVTGAGLPLVGNTAATRPRLGLYGYDSADSDTAIDNAFVVVVTEEDKGLGAFGFDSVTFLPCELPAKHEEEVVLNEETGAPAELVADSDTCLPFDEGKNMWYHSFSMALMDQPGAKPVKAWRDGLLANMTHHGNMLNQPEVNWMTGEFYPAQSTEDMWDFGDYDYTIYNTEIARRGSLLAQDISKALGSRNRLISLPTWKQGTMNQGGPADVMSRRIVPPKNWTLAQNGNPYSYRYMECATPLIQPGVNPNYPDGLCGTSAVNLSATTPDTCWDTDSNLSAGCPAVTFGTSTFGTTLTNPILQGKVLDDGDESTKDSNTTKVLTWHQCQPNGTYTLPNGSTGSCDTASNLADQSWYNPLDVAKGHRGFLDGDMVMMLYAWSPNWRLNAVGHDRYELYVRRSFNGAQTWTTLPKSFTASDGKPYTGGGTVTCETYRTSETNLQGEVEEPHACTTYLPNAPEQARNVTQLKSMRTTTLDPRFAMTGSPTGVSIAQVPTFGAGWQTTEDTRDPSRFFVVYETGDNTTTAEGEPEPQDLFYSRAVNFGDDYAVWYEGENSGNGVTNTSDLGGCYPSDPHLDADVPTTLIGSGFCNEFDQVDRGEPGVEASEASLAANPGGQFLYAAWAQMDHDDGASDAMVRRVWWIDGWISDTWAWVFGQGAGDGVPAPE